MVGLSTPRHPTPAQPTHPTLFLLPTASLAAMTELQREYELANRAEKRNLDLQRQKLLKKVGVRETKQHLVWWSFVQGKHSLDLQRQKLLKQEPRQPSACAHPPTRPHTKTQNEAKAAEAGAKAAKRVGRAKSGREEREEAAKKSAMEELKAARERKARGAEERCACI